jgi:hypothetical protein
MGTRNLTKVVDADGVVRVAQYGQWDGYPSYTGTRVLEFIKEHQMIEKIEKSLAKVRFITDEEAESFSKPYSNGDGWMNLEQGTDFSTMYPSLTRDTGCDILRVLVYSNESIPLVDNSDFENDDLMCEGVYTINYQTKTYTTKWGGFEQSFTFNELPTAENYLRSFESEPANA